MSIFNLITCITMVNTHVFHLHNAVSYTPKNDSVVTISQHHSVQFVQNAAARVLSGTKKIAHITAILKHLHS